MRRLIPDRLPEPPNLAARVEKVMLGDFAFFYRFPARRHRLRITSQVEKERDRLGRSPPGRQWYTIVRWLGPTVLHCLPFEYIAGMTTDVSEATAASVFERTHGRPIP